MGKHKLDVVAMAASLPASTDYIMQQGPDTRRLREATTDMPDKLKASAYPWPGPETSPMVKVLQIDCMLLLAKGGAVPSKLTWDEASSMVNYAILRAWREGVLAERSRVELKQSSIG